MLDYAVYCFARLSYVLESVFEHDNNLTYTSELSCSIYLCTIILYSRDFPSVERKRYRLYSLLLTLVGLLLIKKKKKKKNPPRNIQGG